MTRFVTRPRGINSTPAALASLLNARTRYYPNAKRPNRMFDYRQDFLYYPPLAHHVLNAPSEYDTAAKFFNSFTKLQQRGALAFFNVPIPETYGSRYEAAYALPGQFVVRKMKHMGGSGYRLTNDPTDFVQGNEYVSRVFPKTREYRVIFVKGKPVIILRKHVCEGADASMPWNHAVGASFKTVNDWPSCKLSATDCIARLSACPVVQYAHIVAADVLWNKKGYVVCELNACPGLTIDNNLETIVNALG